MNEPGLIAGWLAAAAEGPVAAELEAVYEYVGAQIESRGPSCWASGRCCGFEKTGHRLYVTGLEAAYTVIRLSGGRDFTPSIAPGGCPLQESNLCGAHAIRPLGCRVYFCDHSAQDWQRALSERAIASIRLIHDRHGVAYRYGEWRSMLGAFARAGLTSGSG